ncbi:MAG: DUF1858 domain-containing protein [Rhizobiales bacterium]|nr:DUF1858 domain-containing protein [Hyphomicrobiales bacterium]
MQRTILDPDLSVDEIMRRWPATIRPFIRRRMLCVGCPIGLFHTVSEACDAHGIDQGAFEAALLEAIQRGAVAEPVAATATPVTGMGPARRGRCGAKRDATPDAGSRRSATERGDL